MAATGLLPISYTELSLCLLFIAMSVMLLSGISMPLLNVKMAPAHEILIMFSFVYYISLTIQTFVF